MMRRSFKSDKLLLEIEASDQHPSCCHGPTVLFYKKNKSDGYYACSAHRDARLCSFHLSADRWTGENININREQFGRTHPHPQIKGSPTHDPALHMKALAQDKVHAQYFFDDHALKFLEDQCRCLEITKVVCMGTPRLHFHLRGKVQSFLLDLDERFATYLGPDEFCHYNMCNNHFFYKREPFEKFLLDSIVDRVLIVTDPPFGCRTELIAHSLRCIRQLHNRLNQLPSTPLSIFWIFPYFSYNHIKQQMPEMEMSDYKFNYTNHKRYTNVGKESRVYGSPVRLFTNVPLSLLSLSAKEGYKYCEKCQFHTAAENRHCDLCQKCTSKNGQTYRHCSLCDTCVKPNYLHCSSCRRCTQREQHNCTLYQSKQVCWICAERGHIESSCGILKKLRILKLTKVKQQQQGCLLCGRKEHRERRCKQRGKYFKEYELMGQKVIKSKF